MIRRPPRSPRLPSATLFRSLCGAEQHRPHHEFDRTPPQYFEGCLPIEELAERGRDTLRFGPMKPVGLVDPRTGREPYAVRSEEHTSELQSQSNLVCRLLLEKKKRQQVQCETDQLLTTHH